MTLILFELDKVGDHPKYLGTDYKRRILDTGTDCKVKVYSPLSHQLSYILILFSGTLYLFNIIERIQKCLQSAIFAYDIEKARAEAKLWAYVSRMIRESGVDVFAFC